MRVELHANAERLAHLTREERDTIRRRVLAAVPHELAPDVHEDFALAEEMAVHAPPRLRSLHREHRAHALVAPSAIPVESKAEPPPARRVNLDALFDELVETLACRLLARLERTAVAAPMVYTTSKRGPHLPGKTRRWMLEHVKLMPGAHKVGRDWTISASDYDAWVTAEDARRCKLAGLKKVSGVVSTATREASNDISNEQGDEAELQRRAERSLRAQGYRRTR
jgi:hypothetical protein